MSQDPFRSWKRPEADLKMKPPYEEDVYFELPEYKELDNFKDCKRIKVYRGRERVYNLQQLTPGDGISFKRKGYKHHAIVSAIVNSKRFLIIHLTGNSADSSFYSLSSGPKANVSETAIDFNAFSKLYKYHYATIRNDGMHPVAAARIIFMHGLPQGYNVLHFNCEHFVCYCITGISYSSQTNRENKVASNLLDDLLQCEFQLQNNIHSLSIGRKRLLSASPVSYIPKGATHPYTRLTTEQHTENETERYGNHFYTNLYSNPYLDDGFDYSGSDYDYIDQYQNSNTQYVHCNPSYQNEFSPYYNTPETFATEMLNNDVNKNGYEAEVTSREHADAKEFAVLRNQMKNSFTAANISVVMSRDNPCYFSTGKFSRDNKCVTGSALQNNVFYLERNNQGCDNYVVFHENENHNENVHSIAKSSRDRRNNCKQSSFLFLNDERHKTRLDKPTFSSEFYTAPEVFI